MTLDRPTAQWRSNPVVRLSAVLLMVFPISNYLLAISANAAGGPTSLTLLYSGLAMGLVLAQIALHSIWTVFSSWHPVFRFSASLMMALILFFSLIGGLWLHHELGHGDLVTSLLCMPLISIAVQAPLWTLKVFWKWEIVPGWNVDTSACRHTLRIRDMLAATGSIAVAFAAVRLAGSLDGTDELLVGLGIASVIISIVSLLVVVVALLATLRAPLVVISTLLAVTFQVALYLAWFATMCLVTREVPPPEVCSLFLGMYFGLVVFLYAPLLYLRYHGYRLR